jgi:2-desacetyl-2-hydroxyethyl bacteriochlorophyllide A dehydrogenase
MSDSRLARHFWVRRPGSGEILTSELPPLRPGEVLVRTLYSAVSRGTESLVFRGQVPPSQRQTMRAPFQEGEFPGPVKYGYSSVGEVLEASGDGAEALVARRVFCLYPHQDRYIVPADRVAVIPDAVPPARAVLAANLETAVNAVWDGGVSVGDVVVVIGAGVVGLLIGWLCRTMPGVRVLAIDPDPSRRAAARALGLELYESAPAGTSADVVFHASGNPDGLAASLALAGVEARIVEASWYGNMSVSLPLGEDFHSRRLTLRSTQVGRLPPEKAPRWSHARRLALALSLLRAPELDALVSGESDFEELPEVMERLSSDATGVLCHRIRYRLP